LLVCQVICAEPFDQSWLLKQWDVDSVDDDEEQKPLKQWQGRRYQRFAKKDAKHAGNHRVTDVAIDALDHELLRRVPRGERTFADRHEQPDRGGHQGETEADENATTHRQANTSYRIRLPEAKGVCAVEEKNRAWDYDRHHEGQ
jgi:hypothetical protein